MLISFFTGEKAEKHRGELRKLLARLTVSQPREPGPWYFYASLLINDEKRTPEDLGRKKNKLIILIEMSDVNSFLMRSLI